MILNESHCLVFLLIPEGSKINRFSKLPQLWNLHYHTLMTLKCHHCLLHPFGKYPKYTRNVVIYAFLIFPYIRNYVFHSLTAFGFGGGTGVWIQGFTYSTISWPQSTPATDLHIYSFIHSFIWNNKHFNYEWLQVLQNSKSQKVLTKE
jgi:hypothetical protein